MNLAIISSFLGSTISSKVITDTISSTTSNIYSLLNSSSFTKHSLDKLIYQLDIIKKIKLIESVLNIIDNLHGVISHLDDKSFKKKSQEYQTIILIIDSIHEMIKNIQNDLSKINEKVIEHSNKWFSNYRSISIDDNINDLKIHLLLLDNRYDFLIKTITVFK